MISLSHKLIFIHIPKCAGQSVEETVLKSISNELTFDNHRHLISCFQKPNSWNKSFPERLAHLKAYEYTELNFIPKEIWTTFHKFTIVRNPVDRVVSMWRYLDNVNCSFDIFVNDFLPGAIDRDNYFFQSQVSYLYDKNKERLLVDEIIPFKELNAYWTNFSKIHHLDSNLIKRNSSNKKAKPLITDSIERRIKDIYRDDYEKLASYF